MQVPHPTSARVRKLVATGNDWPAVVFNLAKARARETTCKNKTSCIFLQSSRLIFDLIWLLVVGDLQADLTIAKGFSSPSCPANH
jgi:hypothetical protein